MFQRKNNLSRTSPANLSPVGSRQVSLLARTRRAIPLLLSRVRAPAIAVRSSFPSSPEVDAYSTTRAQAPQRVFRNTQRPDRAPQHYFPPTPTDSAEPGETIRVLKKPEKRYILSSAQDSIIDQSHDAHVCRHKIPIDNQFKLQPRHRKPVGECFHLKKQTETQKGSLSDVTIKDKLDLNGHGSTTDFAGISIPELVNLLKELELTEVGVLKFSACNIGKSHYLEDLKAALNEAGIQVGYLSGPKGTISDLRINIKVRGKSLNLNIFPMRKGVIRGVLPIPEKFGLKVVEGNVDISFENTRYKRKGTTIGRDRNS